MVSYIEVLYTYKGDAILRHLLFISVDSRPTLYILTIFYSKFDFVSASNFKTG